MTTMTRRRSRSGVWSCGVAGAWGLLAVVGCGRSDQLAGAPANPPSARAESVTAAAVPAPAAPAPPAPSPATSVVVATAAAPLASTPGPAAAPASGPKRYVRPSKADLKSRLTPEQYEVTQEEGTERPFRNAYWNNHEPGLYVDVTTGEPLFSSTDKFESGTGWPSFTRPVEKSRVMQRSDDTLGVSRTEVRSSGGDAHLGHVFDDGPAPTGLRYCINSAALRFIPASRLAAEGYGEYAGLFTAR